MSHLSASSVPQRPAQLPVPDRAQPRLKPLRSCPWAILDAAADLARTLGVVLDDELIARLAQAPSKEVRR